MFELVCVGWACCHMSCARNYWVVLYACPRLLRTHPGHRGFADDPGPRFYLSLS